MMRFPGLVDSHCHFLSLESRGLDPKDCVREFFDAGGEGLLDVAVDQRGWEQRLAVGLLDPRIWFTAGIHPSEASSDLGSALDAVASQALDTRCIAIGEIGLDWHSGRDQETPQRDLFQAQLRLARDLNLPVVIHNREADTELMEVLDASSWAGQGIIHCFSSDLSFAKKVLDRGFLISFAGTLTYPSASNIREVARWVPADRILVETDAPFLAPQPVRGKPNRPTYAGFTAERLGEIRGVPIQEILETTRNNFLNLIGPVAELKRKSNMNSSSLSQS